MDVSTTIKAEPPVLVEYIRFLDEIITGRYDAYGSESPTGNLFITCKGTAFSWGVFTRTLNAGQRGDLIFTNVPGTFLVGVSFSQWDPVANEPIVSDALFALISAQRGDGNVRVIGRNLSEADLCTAVGIVVADNAPYQRRR